MDLRHAKGDRQQSHWKLQRCCISTKHEQDELPAQMSRRSETAKKIMMKMMRMTSTAKAIRDFHKSTAGREVRYFYNTHHEMNS